jgi:hypothetical protein
MIKNKLSSVIAKNSMNDDVESNNILLKWDGKEYCLAPGETVNLLDIFPVTKEQAGMLEARFMGKFPAALKVVDTKTEEDRVEKSRVAEKKQSISSCLTQKAVKEQIKGEKSAEVITYAMDKIEELSSRKT